MSVPDITTLLPSLPKDRFGLGVETLKASSAVVVLLPGIPKFTLSSKYDAEKFTLLTSFFQFPICYLEANLNRLDIIICQSEVILEGLLIKLRIFYAKSSTANRASFSTTLVLFY